MANVASTFLTRQRQRACIIVLLAVCLHMVVIDWGRQQLAAMGTTRNKDQVVSVTLREIARPTAPVRLPVAAAPSSQKPAKKTSPKAPDSSQPSPRLSMNDEAGLPVDAIPEATDVSEHSEITTPEAVPEATPAAGEGVFYHVSPPPSVAISYDVQAIQGTLTYRAMGTITWKTDGQSYTIRGEATSLFMTLLGFDSEGSINNYGIAPARYTEQRFRKPPTTAYFGGEHNTIHFSGSDASYPIVGGEQDRASLVWQLAGIGQGNASQFSVGAVIDIFVVGVRDGEVWRVQVIGQESLSTTIGHINTWHVVRQPKPGSYDQRIDIWFAPDHAWYPIKLRYTEPNEDYLDMSVRSIKLLQ